MTSESKPLEPSADAVAEVLDELHDESGSESEAEIADGAGTQASASLSRKKKKKRSKAMKALNALRGKSDIPHALVEDVLRRVREEQGPGSDEIDEETVRKQLEDLKVMDLFKGKAGIGGKGAKDMGEHKFWSTQPVPQIGEGPPEEDGYIEESVPREQVRQEPYPLPKDFEWTFLDMNNSQECQEVYDLLSQFYVEDKDASFRFQYTADFLAWALQPPGYHKQWHLGVRVSSNKKLVGFISGVPMTIQVRKNMLRVCEINYLCVHRKLRSKRLAPVLIKEITRQVNLTGIFQAIYTAGVVVPTPISTCRYFHRPINIPKLIDINFTHVPRGSTVARMVRLNKLPSVPTLYDGKGLREMEDRDVPQVAELYTKYMRRFTMWPIMTLEEVRHQFLSGKGKGTVPKGNWDVRREGQVVWTYVVEDPETHDITDFFAFYSLPSSIIKSPKHDILEAAYLFYYATNVAFQEDAESSGKLTERLKVLVEDAIVVAAQQGFDVFNALTLMDNVSFLKDLKFGAGDGLLNFYLYNWRTAPLAGFNATDDTPSGKGVGVVML